MHVEFRKLVEGIITGNLSESMKQEDWLRLSHKFDYDEKNITEKDIDDAISSNDKSLHSRAISSDSKLNKRQLEKLSESPFPEISKDAVRVFTNKMTERDINDLMRPHRQDVISHILDNRNLAPENVENAMIIGDEGNRLKALNHAKSDTRHIIMGLGDRSDIVKDAAMRKNIMLLKSMIPKKIK